MQDSVNFFSSKSRKPSVALKNKFILATVHRADNTDDLSKLGDIINAFEEISKSIQIVLPLHPRTRNILNELGYKFNDANFIVIPPVGYLEMVYLLSNCELVMTDSGGLQKEAYMFNKFCITLRSETEWVELVENGYNVLVGSNRQKILDAFLKFDKISMNAGLYGDGKAAEKISRIILAD